MAAKSEADAGILKTIHLRLVAIIFCIYLILPAVHAETRAGTVEFFVGQYSGTGSAGQASNGNSSFTSNFSLAETSVSIKSAFIIFESFFGAYADPPAVTGYLLAFDACQSPCNANATNGNGVIDNNANTLMYDETESNYARLLLNVTAEPQISSYTGGSVLMNVSVAYQLKTATTVTNFIASAKTKLLITYTYDSGSSGVTKTVVYPLESTATGDQGTRTASQAGDCTKNTNCPLFNYAMAAADFSSALSQWFAVQEGSDGHGSSDVIMDVNIQGTDTDSADYVHESANGGTQGFAYHGWFSGVSGFQVNTPQTLEVGLTSPGGDTYYHIGGEVFLTYNASSSASVKTKTVMFPIGIVSLGTTTAEQSASTAVYFPETGVKINKAWLRISEDVMDADGAQSLTVATKVGNDAKGGGKTYNANTGANVVTQNSVIYHVIPSSNYTELESATATSGKTVTVYTTASTTSIRGVSAVLMITYNYTDDSSGYLSSNAVFAGQESNGPSTSFTTASGAVDTVFSETTGTKTLRGAALMSTYSFSDSGASMPTSQSDVDANISTNSCGTSNSFDMGHDGSNAFSSFYKNVTNYLTTDDSQAYTACYSNSHTDTQTAAKHNGILYYVYQWDAPDDLSFTIYVPANNATGRDSETSSQTDFIIFNSTSTTAAKINPYVLNGGAQTDTVAIFRFENTGNVAINITMNFTINAVPSAVTVKAGWSDASYQSSCSATNLTVAGSCVNISVGGAAQQPLLVANMTVAGAVRDVWLWADYNSYAAGSDIPSNITTESYAG